MHSVSQLPAEVCLTDLAWDYPGVEVQVNAFIHSLVCIHRWLEAVACWSEWPSVIFSSGKHCSLGNCAVLYDLGKEIVNLMSGL